jgi:hypothetical protein
MECLKEKRRKEIVSSPISRWGARFIGSQRSGKYAPNLHLAYTTTTQYPLALFPI